MRKMQNDTAPSLAQMEKLNTFLNHLPQPKPVDEHYIDRILNAAPARQTKGHSTSSPRFNWRDMLAPVTSLALACTLGVMMGLSSIGRTGPDIITMDAADYIVGSTPLVEDLEMLK